MSVHFINHQAVTVTINANKGEFQIEAPHRILRGKLTKELMRLARQLDGVKSGGTMIIRSQSMDIEQDSLKKFLQAAAKSAESSPDSEDIRISAIGLQGI